MDGIMDVQLAMASASSEDLAAYPARTSRTGKLQALQLLMTSK